VQLTPLYVIQIKRHLGSKLSRDQLFPSSYVFGRAPLYRLLSFICSGPLGILYLKVQLVLVYHLDKHKYNRWYWALVRHFGYLARAAVQSRAGIWW